MAKFQNVGFAILSLMFVFSSSALCETNSQHGEIIKSRYRLSAKNILAPESYFWNERGGLQFSGTGIGGGLTGSAYRAFCNDQVLILQDALQKSIDENDATGSSVVANRILLQGMIAAAQLHSPSTTYTQTALLRGLQIFSQLKADDALQSPERADFLNAALSSYIQEVIIRKAYQALDHDLIAPWLNRREQMTTDIAQMELQYIDFAKAQLSFVQNNFAGLSLGPTETVVYPVGVSAKEYLKAVELIALYAAYDLHQSLWRDRFSCVTERLIHMNSDLRNFNQGNQFGHIRTKLERIYFLTEQVRIQLGGNSSCWSSQNNF